MSAKKYFALMLFCIILAFTFPALAANEEAPVIEFDTDGYFRGFPVIYANDISSGGERLFTGFTVSDNDTAFFYDITFIEGKNLPFTGVYRVIYNDGALCGFTRPGEGEVTITATDASGNTAAVTAWCVVRPVMAPYYADDPGNPCNERENRTSITVNAGEALMFDSTDFINERLIGDLGAIYVDSLPDNGALSFYSAGKYNEIKKKELPFCVSLDQIHAGKLIYTSEKPGGDSIMLRLEDIFGNTAAMQTEIELTILAKDAEEEMIEGKEAEAEAAAEGKAAEAPEISIDMPNEANEYYLPHIVRVTDESGVEKVEGVKEARNGTYRLEMSYGEDKTILIKAANALGLTSEMNIKMLAIPDATGIDSSGDPEELRRIVREINAELKTLGDMDPFVLTTPEKQKLIQTLDTLLWEADAIELINAGQDALAGEEELLSRLPGLEFVSEDIASELLESYILKKAGEQILLAQRQEGVKVGELMRALEDAVIHDALSSSPDKVLKNMDSIHVIYNDLLFRSNVSYVYGDMFLLGMLSRLDYPVAPENAGYAHVLFEAKEAEQKSAAKDSEDGEEDAGEKIAEEESRVEEENSEGQYYFIGALELNIRLKNVGMANGKAELAEGRQGFLCMPMLKYGDFYDMSSLRAYRAEENASVELEVIGTGSDYIMLPISSMGRIEFYAQLSNKSGQSAEKAVPDSPQEQGSEPGRAHEQEPEPGEIHGQEPVAPEPMQRPEVTEPASQPAKEPYNEPAPTPVKVPEEIVLPVDSARIPPIYVIGGCTLLILLMRVIVGLAKYRRKASE